MKDPLDSQLLKFAIVGFGHIGKRHMELIGSVSEAMLVGVCDTDEGKMKGLGDIPCFTDINDLLASTTADIVVISTPHYLHFEQTMLCLQKGFHVLVEKPMALKTSEAKEMIRFAKEHNRKLWVVKQNRFNTPVFALDHLIKSGKLGDVYFIEAHVLWNRNHAYYDQSSWRGRQMEEGGALYTHASHFIDLMVEWGGEIMDAVGYCVKRQQDIETEDLGSASVKFESGAIGSIQWTTLAHQKNFEGSISVVGQKGTVKIGGPYLNQFDYWNVEGYPLPGINWGEDVNDEFGLYQDFGNNHVKVYKAIVHEMLSGRKLGVDGMDGLKSIAAIELIYSKISWLE